MKRFLLPLLAIGAVIVVGYVFRNTSYVDNLLYIYPCKEPIYYNIGDIDQEFGLSREYLESKASHAASIWNLATGKRHFEYRKDAELSINLLYDERQTYILKVHELDQKLNAGKDSLDSAIAKHENDSSKFKDRRDRLNEQIKYWNEKGGAPPEEYEKLKKEQEALEEEAKRLNATAKTLNQTAGTFNADVKNLNQTVDTFNALLKTKPEQGVYNPNENRIDIYFADNEQELVRTLAHELGHARGLDHIQNPDALMYFRTTQKTTVTADDLEIIEAHCQKQSKFTELKERIKLAFEEKQAQ